MDINIVDLISNVGFPISMVIAMMWYICKSNNQHLEQINSLNDKHSELVDKLADKHKEESKEFKESLDKNSEALNRLADGLEYIKYTGGIRNEKESD